MFDGILKTPLQSIFSIGQNFDFKYIVGKCHVKALVKISRNQLVLFLRSALSIWKIFNSRAGEDVGRNILVYNDAFLSNALTIP